MKINEVFASEAQLLQLQRCFKIERCCFALRGVFLGILFGAGVSMVTGFDRPAWYLEALFSVGIASDLFRYHIQRKRLALMEYIETHQKKADWDEEEKL